MLLSSFGDDIPNQLDGWFNPGSWILATKGWPRFLAPNLYGKEHIPRTKMDRNGGSFPGFSKFSIQFGGYSKGKSAGRPQGQWLTTVISPESMKNDDSKMSLPKCGESCRISLYTDINIRYIYIYNICIYEIRCSYNWELAWCNS